MNLGLQSPGFLLLPLVMPRKRMMLTIPVARNNP
jgi:hypothetical protein